MTCTPQPRKHRCKIPSRTAFSSSSEMLTAKLPVENMTISQRIIGPNATASFTVAQRHLPGNRLLMVCDDNTWAAAGEKIRTLLPSTVHNLGRHPHATLALAETLAEEAQNYDGLIAVGSGTVNDLTKYAAAKAQKPYIVVATAASMNGYSSANASLEENGIKRSFPAAPPRAIIADTTIIAAAPRRLMRAGLGDTLCRSTVETDMLLSHWLLETPYPRTLFDVLRRHEAALMADAHHAREGDTAFAAQLMEALLDAGDAMNTHGSSAVASQGEHMIAHTVDMMFGAELRDLLHGEMIALTTQTMSHLQHKMLLSQPHVKPMPREHAQFLLQFGKRASRGLEEYYNKKLLTTERAEHVNARIAKHWPEIKTSLTEIMLPTNQLELAFMHSGLALKPEEIGLSEERYRFACTYAYLTRDRFTFLDLAAMNDKRVS